MFRSWFVIPIHEARGRMGHLQLFVRASCYEQSSVEFWRRGPSTQIQTSTSVWKDGKIRSLHVPTCITSFAVTLNTRRCWRTITVTVCCPASDNIDYNTCISQRFSMLEHIISSLDRWLDMNITPNSSNRPHFACTDHDGKTRLEWRSLVRVPPYYVHANLRATSQHTFKRSCGHSKVCCVVAQTFAWK